MIRSFVYPFVLAAVVAFASLAAPQASLIRAQRILAARSLAMVRK